MRRGECCPQRLAMLLERDHLSIEALSVGTNIPLPALRGYLNGKKDAISTRNMLLLAQAFNMPMANLVDYLAGALTLEQVSGHNE